MPCNCNVDVCNLLIAKYGGQTHKVGRSVIYQNPEGKQFLVRFTSGNTVTISQPLYDGKLDGVWFCFKDRRAGVVLFSSGLKVVSHQHTTVTLQYMFVIFLRFNYKINNL